MNAATWMIYGATGYTGRLIAEAAVQRGLRPILAGRSAEVAALADRLGLEHRVFPLGSPDETAPHLASVRAVLHCAGPFEITSRPMVEACLRAKVHYLDISAEIDACEAILSRSERFERAGIAAIPGTGLAVATSDCLAALLKQKMPSAVRLLLTLLPKGKLSPGTVRLMLEGIRRGHRVRRDGVIESPASAPPNREIEIAGRRWGAVPIPWGDVATAYYATGIPNIETYIAMPRWQTPLFPLIRAVARTRIVQWLARKLVSRFVDGPGPAARAAASSRFHAEARDAAGNAVTLRLCAPGGYDHTIDTSLACVDATLAGRARPGAATPSMAFGPELVLALPNVHLEPDREAITTRPARLHAA